MPSEVLSEPATRGRCLYRRFPTKMGEAAGAEAPDGAGSESANDEIGRRVFEEWNPTVRNGDRAPQISLLGRVYVNAPAPRGVGRLSLAGLLRTRRKACWRRPKNPFIGPSVPLGPEPH